MLNRRTTKLTALGIALVMSACGHTPREPAEGRDQRLAQSRQADKIRPSQAPPPASCDSQRLELLLAAPHDPPTDEELLATCADPAPILSKIAKDRDARGLVRLRAIESLGQVGGTGSVRVLADLATALGELASVRRTAVRALEDVTKPSDLERERVGTQALSDPDPHVRAAAARLLGAGASPSARAALEKARARESEPFVREQMDRSTR